MLAFFSWVPGKVAAGRKGGIQTQCLPRLTAAHKPSIYPAWRPPANPAFIPLGCRPQTQCLPRLAAARKPSIYPAWRLPANPVFVPLGGYPQTQHLSRLAASRKPSIYPAWRPALPTNPAFIPLGGLPRAQCLPRLTAAHKPSIYPAWRLLANPAFIPLGGCPSHKPSVYPAWRAPNLVFFAAVAAEAAQAENLGIRVGVEAFLSFATADGVAREHGTEAVVECGIAVFDVAKFVGEDRLAVRRA